MAPFVRSTDHHLSLTLDHGHPEGAFVPRHETLEVLEQQPSVVALRLQFADLLVLVQHLLARRVQLSRDSRELLKIFQKVRSMFKGC